MLPSFAKDTITVLRPTTKVERGSKVFDYVNGTQMQIDGCSVQPAEATLSLDGRVLAETDSLTIYAPPSSDIRAEDHILTGGLEYYVDGEPRHWNSATGRTSSLMLRVKRWQG